MIYLQNVWVAAAGRVEFFIKNGTGKWDENGNFIFSDGHWIGYAQDNASHPAFNKE